MIRTPDQRVRVFVSSTLGELGAERQAVTAAINQLRLTPVLFELGARPYPPRDLYRAYLEQSDVFVGIYASSYGWVAPGMEISGLEDEYRLSAGKPRLIYTKRTATREARLTEFLDKIQGEGVVSYRPFQDAGELGSLVADDLAVLLTERFTSAGAAPPPPPAAAASATTPSPAAAERPPAMPSAPPAPSAPAVSPPVLPALRRPLIDRVDELKLVTEMLLAPDVGLVTLTGPGGVGKTMLALAAAAAVAAEFADGAAFISLETLTDPALIRDSVAQQLHVPAVPGQPLRESLLAFLTPRHLLIVVDNVEQLVSAAPLAEQALEQAPGLKALVTSREPLRVRGERVVPVTPFTLPEPGITVDLEALAVVPAVAFFLACAREVQPGFTLTEANAAAVAEICRRLDGLPLALQLAAARLIVLSPAALLARLERRLALLTRGPRDLPPRQQTLRAAIAWSYDLLRPAEQRLFRQLGVFVGGFTLKMVEALTADAPGSPDPLEVISALVSQNVVFARPQDDGVPRYGMLDTIREFAQEQLDAHGETAAMRRRHAEMMRDLCERAEPMLLVPAQRSYWMAQLWNAQDNIRAALAWSLGADGELAIGITIAGMLGWYWLMSGRLEEAASWYGEFLGRRDESDGSVAWAIVLHGSALQLWGRADLGQAAAREEAAVEIFRSAGENRWLAYSLSLLARVRTGQGKLAEARSLLDQARTVWGRVQNTYGQPFDAYLRYYQGSAALMQGDAGTAETLFESSLRELEASGDEMASGVVLGSLGLLAAQRGEHDEARARFAAGLPLLRSGDDEWDLALLLLNSGLEEAAVAPATAGPLLAEALRAWRRLAGTAGVALSLAGLGEVAAGRGAPDRAGRLFGAGRALLPGGDPLLAVIVPYDLPSRLAAARADGDPVLFDQGLADGQAWTVDEAVAAGLDSVNDLGTRPA
jgi:predicted ATPase